MVMSKLTKIMKELTPEKMEEIRLEQIKENKGLSVEYQLGDYIGEYIIFHYLPTLNIDIIKSRNVIKVSKNEKLKISELEKKWTETFNLNPKDNNFLKGDSELWIEYSKFYNFLAEKYLPKVLKCRIHPLNVENMAELKRGIIDKLWGCDICLYNLEPENIKIYDDEYGFYSIVELTLDLTKN